MAGFSGLSFIYDGIPSKKYGVFICEINNTSDSEITAETYNVKSYTTLRSYIRYFYGYDEKEPLSFSLTIASEEPIDTYLRSQLLRWLVGRNGYKTLRIIQPDMVPVSYECVFTSATTYYVGKVPIGLTLTAICNSPYQFGSPITLSGNINGNFTVHNISDLDDYVYPNFSFTVPSCGGDIEITNTNDENRSTLFQDLLAGETITVDSQKQILLSSTNSTRMERFNKKWLRLCSGTNILNIKHYIPSYTYTAGSGGLAATRTYEISPDNPEWEWNVYVANPVYTIKGTKSYSMDKSELKTNGIKYVYSSSDMSVGINSLTGQLTITQASGSGYNLSDIWYVNSGAWFISSSIVGNIVVSYYRGTKNLDYSPYSIVKYEAQATSYSNSTTMMGTVESTDENKYPLNGYQLDRIDNQVKWYVRNQNPNVETHTENIDYCFCVNNTYYCFNLPQSLSEGDELIYSEGVLKAVISGVETVISTHEEMSGVDLTDDIERSVAATNSEVAFSIIVPVIRRVGA